MSYTKLFGDISKKMTIYVGTDCNNCKCTNENLIFSFGKWDETIRLCKNCINTFMEETFKPNKECNECKDYFEEVIETKTINFFKGNIVSVNMCKECNEICGLSDEQILKYQEKCLKEQEKCLKEQENKMREREEFELDVESNF
jgi:hypothetical protein